MNGEEKGVMLIVLTIYAHRPSPDSSNDLTEGAVSTNMETREWLYVLQNIRNDVDQVFLTVLIAYSDRYSPSDRFSTSDRYSP